MRKFLSLLFSVMLIAAMANAQDNAPTVRSYYDGPNWETQADTGITCSPAPPGIFFDDGTYENGYRSVVTGDSTTFLHKMRLGPTQHSINAVCVTWTALAPSGNITFDLIVYDTLGAGGQPGSFVTRVNGVVGNAVGIFPLHSRYRYAVTWALPQNAYYVGVRWNNNPILPFFISSDENSATLGLGYNRTTTTFPPVWSLTTTGFPNFKWHGIRMEAAPTPFGETRCRNGLNIVIPALGSANPDSVLFATGGGTVSDVNVRIDTVVHTWDSDLIFYLRKGINGVRIINQVGGSGDNFIGTILDDEATTPIASGVAPFTGSFQPSSPLSVFDANLKDGYWRLHITDTVAGDSGFLRAWCVVLGILYSGGIQTVEIPNTFRLYQNYPNPFNPVTKIKFGLPKNDNIKLTVYDALGREVAVLVNEYKTANTYEVEFDGTNLSTGVYFYKLEATDYFNVKKMLILK